MSEGDTMIFSESCIFLEMQKNELLKVFKYL